MNDLLGGVHAFGLKIPSKPLAVILMCGTAVILLHAILTDWGKANTTMPSSVIQTADEQTQVKTNESRCSMTENSVTQWIADLKAGDPGAAQQLAERNFDRLVAPARRQLGNAPRRVADEEGQVRDPTVELWESLRKQVDTVHAVQIPMIPDPD